MSAHLQFNAVADWMPNPIQTNAPYAFIGPLRSTLRSTQRDSRGSG
jgi:hypothetical protein